MFTLSEQLAQALATGDFSDEFDELDEKLTAMESNVDVRTRVDFGCICSGRQQWYLFLLSFHSRPCWSLFTR